MQKEIYTDFYSIKSYKKPHVHSILRRNISYHSKSQQLHSYAKSLLDVLALQLESAELTRNAHRRCF